MLAYPRSSLAWALHVHNSEPCFSSRLVLNLSHDMATGGVTIVRFHPWFLTTLRSALHFVVVPVDSRHALLCPCFCHCICKPGWSYAHGDATVCQLWAEAGAPAQCTNRKTGTLALAARCDEAAQDVHGVASEQLVRPRPPLTFAMRTSTFSMCAHRESIRICEEGFAYMDVGRAQGWPAAPRVC